MPANIDATYILKKPLLSEKGTFAMNEFNRYSFVVDARATKPEIKAAVEKIYKVRVLSLNTMKQKHRTRVNKFGAWTPAETKKAVVRLHKEDKLDLF